jgi:hypothetical protein
VAIELQELIERAASAGDDTTPADAVAAALAEAGLTRPEVEALQNEALEKFSALKAKNDTEGLSPAEVDGFEQLAAAIEGTAAEQTRLADVDAEHQARLAAIADRVNKFATPADPEGDEPAGDEPVEPEAATETPAADTPESAAEPTDAPAAEPVAQPEAVAASAKKSTKPFNIATIRNKAPAPLPTNPGGLSIVAAAEVRGFSTGQELHGATDLAKAFAAKFAGMPQGKARLAAPIRSAVASLQTEYPPELTAEFQDDTNVVEHAASLSRIEKASGKKGLDALAAAGGWCSVSEVSYDLAEDLTSDSAGLIDVPDVATPRGGIRTPITPDYSNVFAEDVGIIRTEAEEDPIDPEDYVEKPFYEVPCTTWVESRAGIVFTGVESGILQDNAYPELGARHVSLATSVHRHRYNQKSIALMEAGSTAWSGLGFGPSATSGILNGVGFLSKHLQYKYRAEPNMLLEWVFPEYVKEIIRADYSLRAGIALEHVTDADIDRWFAERNARVQWVYDWQDAYATGGNFGASTAPTAYPTTVKALAYPAGTWVRGRGDVINLDAIYDTAGLKRNQFLKMFFEEKLLVHKRAYVSYVATLNLGVSGTTGTGRVLDAQGKVAA